LIPHGEGECRKRKYRLPSAFLQNSPDRGKDNRTWKRYRFIENGRRLKEEKKRDQAQWEGWVGTRRIVSILPDGFLKGY